MDHPRVEPYPLVDRNESANFVRGVYDDTPLAGTSIYRIGDLVTTRSGKVARAIQAAADIGSIAIAGQPYNREPLDGARYAALFANGVPLNRIYAYEEWVFQLDGTLDAAALTAIRSGAKRDIAYDATDDVLLVLPTSATPAVQLVAPLAGMAEGDTHAHVIVKWLPGPLL